MSNVIQLDEHRPSGFRHISEILADVLAKRTALYEIDRRIADAKADWEDAFAIGDETARLHALSKLAELRGERAQLLRRQARRSAT